ncbi:lactonase family protein [Nocardia harenae]|uniref:lactonase family protein n=1 Tax=Nocardia harenae TaxID=358707 RepID=UPI000831EE2D|nr:beta-propeller fold lactonase family protein [Nocardia harenae]
MGAAPARAEPGAQYIYVGGAFNEGVAGFEVRPDADPKPVGATVPAPSGSYSVEVTPDGKYVYVASSSENRIAAFAIAPGGTLTELPGSPLLTADRIVAVAAAPDGRHLYATTTDGVRGAVITYSIAGGLPVRVATTPLDITTHFAFLAVAPDGRTLYVDDYVGGQILRLPLDSDGIALEPRQRIAAGATPINPAVSPDGKLLYVSNEVTGTLTGFGIAADGTLTPLPGSPFPTLPGNRGITFSADSSRAYVAHALNSVSGYRLGADGGLTPLPGSPYSAGAIPSAPGLSFFDRDGERLYVVTLGSLSSAGPSTLQGFDVLPDGALRPFGPPIDTGRLFTDGLAADITP